MLSMMLYDSVFQTTEGHYRIYMVMARSGPRGGGRDRLDGGFVVYRSVGSAVISAKQRR